MVRIDTAGFYKYLVFHWHSKNKLVIWWDDTWPVDNPTSPYVPCDHCPEWYNCFNDECLPSEPGVPIVVDPEPIPIDSPTVETECRTFSSRGAWIKTTASWVFTWSNANSWWQWTFRCYNSITFYWRLNHWLLNDIRWWVWNHTRSFTVPEWSIDEQSIFKFEVNANWEYTISIKRKASWDSYYDWDVYQHWVLEEADWETLYVWISALAEIWSVTAEKDREEETVILYSWDNWQIIHNIVNSEITLTKADWESITIMDRNLWATAYLWQPWATAADSYWKFYQWWNNYWFPNSWAITKSNVQVDASWNSWQNPINSSTFIYWSSNWMNPSNGELWWKTEWTEISRQWPCPNGWHVPSKAEMDKLLSIYQSITWIGSTWWYVKLEQYLLFTYPWYRRYTNWEVSYQWQSYNWVHLLTNDMNQQLYYWNSRRYYNTNSVWCWNPIRPFKNVT